MRAELIDAYIKSKALSWSVTTQKTERSRLVSVSKLLDTSLSDPSAVYGALSKTMKPYTIKTTFIRLSALCEWLVNSPIEGFDSNPYKKFIRENALLFRNVYDKKRVGVSFAEATRKISDIRDGAVQEKARHLLKTGARYSESFTEDSDGYITGKGGSRRRIFFKDNSQYKGTYNGFYKALKKVGLKPHDLRKIFATELVSKGVKEIDLLEIMGWKSMQTAASYLQPKRESELEQIVKSISGV